MSVAGVAYRGGALACGLPRRRRTPRGRLRWYLVQVPEGRERSARESLRRLVVQKDRVSKADRHRRICLIRTSRADGGLVERMPIDVPFKG